MPYQYPFYLKADARKSLLFLSLPILKIEKIWFPLIKTWLAQNFTPNQIIYLVIDRTKWECKNLIMISLIYDQRAIPIYFEFLPKLGSSNFEDQSRIFSQVITLFKKYKTVVLGDREFCSVKLANWLREEKLQFCLRLKKNEFIQAEDGIWQELNNLGLKPGISLFLENMKVTKTQKLQGFNVACKWKRSFKQLVAGFF